MIKQSRGRKAQVHVYSDPVLCLGKMQENSEAYRRWTNQLEEVRLSNSYRELFGIDGEPIKFEWSIFPGRTSLEILQKIQKDLKDRNIEPENFEHRIIFMSMLNDIDWSERCIANSEQVRITRRDSREDTGHSKAHAMKRNGTELAATHLKKNGIPSPQKW